MMMMQSRKIWYYRITLIILLFAMLLAWALLPGVHEFINRSVAAFAAVDQQGIERFIQSYGALSNQLCCRFDFNTFSLVFYRHRAWSVTGNYCLFLGGQHVNRRYFLVCHRTVYSVCPDRGDFYGEENMA